MQDQAGRAWLNIQTERDENGPTTGASVIIHDDGLIPNISDVITLMYRATTIDAKPLIKAVGLRLKSIGLRGIGIVMEGDKFMIAALSDTTTSPEAAKLLNAATDGLDLSSYKRPVDKDTSGMPMQIALGLDDLAALVGEIEYLRNCVVAVHGGKVSPHA